MAPHEEPEIVQLPHSYRSPNTLGSIEAPPRLTLSVSRAVFLDQVYFHFISDTGDLALCAPTPTQRVSAGSPSKSDCISRQIVSQKTSAQLSITQVPASGHVVFRLGCPTLTHSRLLASARKAELCEQPCEARAPSFSSQRSRLRVGLGPCAPGGLSASPASTRRRPIAVVRDAVRKASAHARASAARRRAIARYRAPGTPQLAPASALAAARRTYRATAARARCGAAHCATATRSMRTAAALNSAVPDLGSVASMVSRLVSTSSGKWKVMNTSPGRRDGST